MLICSCCVIRSGATSGLICPISSDECKQTLVEWFFFLLAHEKFPWAVWWKMSLPVYVWCRFCGLQTSITAVHNNMSKWPTLSPPSHPKGVPVFCFFLLTLLVWGNVMTENVINKITNVYTVCTPGGLSCDLRLLVCFLTACMRSMGLSEITPL